MQQRYYDPAVGRFLSIDPIHSEFAQYSYARNNPFKFVDPDGRKAAGSGDDPKDPMNDPDRPNGCGKVRACSRDAEGWHTGGAGSTGVQDPGGAFVVDTVKPIKGGGTVTTFKPRPMTDEEARGIFAMALFPGARTATMNQAGRDLATSMFWYVRARAGAMKAMKEVSSHAAGAGGDVETAHAIYTSALRSGKEKLEGDKNYVELHAEMGQGLIGATAGPFRDDYESWRSGAWSPP